MSIQITDTHKSKVERSGVDEELIIVETDAPVRYVFRRFLPNGHVQFSHRLYEHREGAEKYQEHNYELPEAVVEWISNEYGYFEYMDGMVDQARRIRYILTAE